MALPALAVLPFVAFPWPRAALARLPFTWVTHITYATNLLRRDGGSGIITRRSNRVDDTWTACDVDLRGSSGFSEIGARLVRDYSVFDFELNLNERGTYTYFFFGDPSLWGLVKNFGVMSEEGLRKKGFALIRISNEDLLTHYSGPIFFRLDDKALVIRGSYAGPAKVSGIPIG